jgi:hypothetical protein
MLQPLCVVIVSASVCERPFTSTDPAQMTKRFTVSAELEWRSSPDS